MIYKQFFFLNYVYLSDFLAFNCGIHFLFNMYHRIFEKCRKTYYNNYKQFFNSF